MKRYVKTTKYVCIDTRDMIPHLECYLEQNGHLIAEQINGYTIDLGEILLASDSLAEVEGYDQSVFI